MTAHNDPLTTARALTAAQALAREHALPAAQATLIADANNVLVHLRPAPVVVRVVTTGARFNDPPARLARELALAGWLTEHGAPVIAPSAELPAGPHCRDGMWMSCWTHVELDEQAHADPQEAAGALALLHSILECCPVELPLLEPVLGELPRVIEALAQTPLDPEALALLREAFEAVASALATAEEPPRPLHGDAHAGNLLRSRGELVWSDFEDACRGPLGWDLACLITPVAALAEAVLDAYGEAARSAVGDRELEPFLDARALHATVWWCWLARGGEADRRGRADQWLRFWRDRLDRSGP